MGRGCDTVTGLNKPSFSVPAFLVFGFPDYFLYLCPVQEENCWCLSTNMNTQMGSEELQYVYTSELGTVRPSSP